MQVLQPEHVQMVAAARPANASAEGDARQGAQSLYLAPKPPSLGALQAAKAILASLPREGASEADKLLVVCQRLAEVSTVSIHPLTGDFASMWSAWDLA